MRLWRLVHIVILLLRIRNLFLHQRLLLRESLLPRSEAPRQRSDGHLGTRWDEDPPLDGGASEDAVEPGADVGELAREVDGGVRSVIRPADDGDVGEGVAAAAGADDEVAGGEVGVEDAVEALGFAYVALCGIGDAFSGVADKVVCLALPLVSHGVLMTE